MKLLSRSLAPVTLILALFVLTGCPKPPAPPEAPVPTQPPAVPALPQELLPVVPESIPPSASVPAGFTQSPQLEFYGNYETAGVLADLPEGIEPDKIKRVECYLNVDGEWSRVQDLVQVGAFPVYATSLFWLQPGSTYQVKVVFKDRAGKDIVTRFRSGSTRPDFVMPETAAKLFVSPEGNDSNPGTIEKPFKTLLKAVGVTKPGTTVILRGGTYYEGDLVLPVKGSQTKPIVIKAYPGEKVALDGSDPDLMDHSVWEEAGDGLYTHAMNGESFNCILEDRETGECIRMLPLHTADELRARSVKNFGEFSKMEIDAAFCCDGETATLMPPKPLENYIVHIGRANKAFILENQRHLVFDGLEMRYYGKGHYACAALIYSTSDVCFQNCRILFCDTGLWVKMNSDRVTIQDCTFVDGTANFPFGMLKTGGAKTSFEGGAVYVDAKFSGRGLVVRRNRIEGWFDGVHLTSWILDDARSNEIDFYQNVVLDCVDDFIEADGFSRNVRIFDNFMRRSLSGISIAQALDGPTYCVYNVLADCGVVPACTREDNYGYPFKTNGGDGWEIGSGPVYFYHNTAYTLDPKSRAMLVKRAKWRKITFRNNIWCGNELGFEIWEDRPSPMDLDYDNLYVANTNAPLFLVAYRRKYMNLDEVRSKLKYLKHGISAEPRLSDPKAGVYTLLADSPCIDAGTPVPGINDGRAKGSAPDMGAYEAR